MITVRYFDLFFCELRQICYFFNLGVRLVFTKKTASDYSTYYVYVRGFAGTYLFIPGFWHGTTPSLLLLPITMRPLDLFFCEFCQICYLFNLGVRLVFDRIRSSF